MSGMKYRQTLSRRDSTAFALLFLMPWLGVPLLIWRKKTLGVDILVYDYLILVAGAAIYAALWTTGQQTLIRFVGATVGSMCVGTFLLIIEEARVAKWSIKIGNHPFVVLLLGGSLPLVFYQIVSLMRGGPVECSRDMRISVVAVAIVTACFLIGARALTSNRTLLDGYFEEFPDNEVVYLVAGLATIAMVVIWPTFNESIPSLSSIFGCMW